MYNINFDIGNIKIEKLNIRNFKKENHKNRNLVRGNSTRNKITKKWLKLKIKPSDQVMLV